VSAKLSVINNLLLAGLTALLAHPAMAGITCCEINGKRVCGDPPPQQCLTRAKTIFNKGGVAQQIEAPLTAEERVARQAEEAKRIETEKKATEQARRDRALRESYANEREIDVARDRAIAEIEKNSQQASSRLEAALKKQKQLLQEKEFYQKKPIPANLQTQLQDNDNEIAAQQKALQEKDAHIAEVTANFAADKQRYHEIVSGTAR
jgi:hypothetical protein